MASNAPQTTDPEISGWRFDERATHIWHTILGADMLAQVFVPCADTALRDDGQMPMAAKFLLDFCSGRRAVLWASEWGGLEAWNGEKANAD